MTNSKQKRTNFNRFQNITNRISIYLALKLKYNLKNVKRMLDLSVFY